MTHNPPSMNGSGNNGARGDAFPEPVAIVGVAGCFSGARDVRAYWQNIVDGRDCVGEASEQWLGPYFDPDSKENDRIYTKKGGFLNDLAEFNPMEFGIMPGSVDGGEPDHYLALKLARDALIDADYMDRDFNREKAGIVLGRGTYINRGYTTLMQHGMMVDQTLAVVRQLRPDLTDADITELRAGLKKQLPAFNTEMSPGLVPNVTTGIIANRLDLMGPNYIIDAACASSLIAIELACRELFSGRCDMVLTGGCQAHTPPQLMMIFCQLGALTRGDIRPFDVRAAGTLLGEGAGMLAVKRLSDAEADGDRIYAVIRGLGTSSDGKAKGLLAPRAEGEELALRRAYESSGIDPATIGLIEAHGTGIALGDKTEIGSLGTIFGARDETVDLPRTGIGSVKSMISHCIPAAGAAAMIKTALALHHKVLPPTLCDEVNPALELEETPFYVNNVTRPWIHGGAHPRRAGVNAFGFGGVNAHAIVEEYTPKTGAQGRGYSGGHSPGSLHAPATELVVLAADSADALRQRVTALHARLEGEPGLSLAAVAAATADAAGNHRLAIIASDTADLVDKLSTAADKLADGKAFKTRSGITYNHGEAPGKVAFVFPGEGAQYTNMLAELALHFPQVRDWFDFIDATSDHRDIKPSDVIFPVPTGLPGLARTELEARLYDMDLASESVFTASMALHTLLTDLGVKPDVMVGHSTGENSALVASKTLRAASRVELAEAIRRMNAIYQELDAAGKIESGALLTVGALPPDKRNAVLADYPDLVVAMDNCPNQVVLYGDNDTVTRAAKALSAAGAVCAPLPFGRAYHTERFAPVAEAFRGFYAEQDMGPGDVPVVSCATLQAFGTDPEAIRDLAAQQWTQTVRFADTVQTLVDDGVGVFVEVGPSANLTSFVSDTLGKRHPAIAVASDSRRQGGVKQIQRLLAALFTAGVDVHLPGLYAHRDVPAVDLTAEPAPAKPRPHLNLHLPALTVPADFQRALPTAVADTVDTTQADQADPAADNGGTDASASSKRDDVRSGTSQDVAEASPEPSSAAARVTSTPTPMPASDATPAPQSPSQPPADPRLSALQSHFALMQDFLASQARVFGGASTAAANNQPATAETAATATPTASDAQTPAPVATPAPDPRAAFPMLGEVIEHTTDHLRARRTFTLDNDPFLTDHTIGSLPSAVDPTLLPLPVMPFTFSMEVIAEAAVKLVRDALPAARVVGMREVRGHRWLALDDGTLSLNIEAQRVEPCDADATVQVRLFLDTPDNAMGQVLVFEGFVDLGTTYAAPPEPRPWNARKEYGARSNPDGELYAHGMFHGPRLQGVTHLRRWADEAIDADMRVISTADYFAFTDAPVFQLDPALLDAAGQLAGYWLTEKHGWGFNCFPFRLGRFTPYADPLMADATVLCRGDLAFTGPERIEAAFDIVGADGQLLMRCEQWEDRKFTVPDRYYDYRLRPQTEFISEPHPAVNDPDLVVRRVEPFAAGFLDQGWGIWKRMLAHMSLSRAERADFYDLPVTGPRREEWLMSRIAAKDAVRAWAQARHDLHLAPADIEVVIGPLGAPAVKCAALETVGAPTLSIAHSRRHAVAAVSTGIVGVDYQRLVAVHLDELVHGAMSESEARRVHDAPPSERERLAVAMWAAKEAAAKAMGTGLQGRPRDWVVTAIALDHRNGQAPTAQVQHEDASFEVSLYAEGSDAVLAICQPRASAPAVHQRVATAGAC